VELSRLRQTEHHVEHLARMFGVPSHAADMRSTLGHSAFAGVLATVGDARKIISLFDVASARMGRSTAACGHERGRQLTWLVPRMSCMSALRPSEAPGQPGKAATLAPGATLPVSQEKQPPSRGGHGGRRLLLPDRSMRQRSPAPATAFNIQRVRMRASACNILAAGSQRALRPGRQRWRACVCVLSAEGGCASLAIEMPVGT
jgi:hypothetical protein